MMTFKKVIGKLHLWLGFTSGLVVVFLGITGCILAFQHEIETVTAPYQYVEKQNKTFLPPTVIKSIAVKNLPDKLAHSVTYSSGEKAAVVSFFSAAPEYYYLVYINPYTGQVLKVKDMSRDFFRIVIMGHYYLWLPPNIGQPILASATLIFVIMLITGLILWWPKNKAATKQRFTIKWNANWRRTNYDLHNVVGFYITWLVIFIALSGLVMGFQWFAKTVYFTASGGKTMVEFSEPHTPKPLAVSKTAGMTNVDQLWHKMAAEHPAVETIEIHYPENDSVALAAAMNPDADTYWQTDYRYFNQYTLQEISVNHIYGRAKDNSAADKIMRMNYDIHVGAIWGLPGKILAFLASLFAASLPVTGFYIWWGRRKKNKAGQRGKEKLTRSSEKGLVLKFQQAKKPVIIK